jgi:hypothetical protein
MRNTPIGRINKHNVYETSDPNDFEIVGDFGHVWYVRYEKTHFGGAWVLLNHRGRWATMFDLIEALPR